MLLIQLANLLLAAFLRGLPLKWIPQPINELRREKTKRNPVQVSKKAAAEQISMDAATVEQQFKLDGIFTLM